MFLHIFKYNLLRLLREKWCIGWNLLFPLILATAFYAGFGTFIKDDDSALDTIPVATLNCDELSYFNTMLEGITDEDEGLISITYVDSYDEGYALVDSGEATGFYYYDAGSDNTDLSSDSSAGGSNTSNSSDNSDGSAVSSSDNSGISLLVSENGIESTILSNLIETYNAYADIFVNVSENNPDMTDEISNAFYESTGLERVTFRENPANPMMQYFYSLIAMAALFGSWISSEILKGICANQSENGKRFEVSPVRRSTAVISTSLAGLLVQCISNVMLVLYIEYVLGLSFEAPLSLVLLVTVLGSGVGITSGIMIGAVFAEHKKLVTVLPLAFSMVASFLSGLMVGNIKALIEEHVPVINRLNPAAVLTDGLYVLGTYGITDDYWRDVISLLIFSVIFIIISVIRLRKGAYQSV